MTDLQLGLLVLGGVAVVGVVAYNRLQERATRREAERSFASSHPDVLAGEPAAEPPGRREPVLAQPLDADERLDYVMQVQGVPLAELEGRFRGRARVSDGAVCLQMVSRRGVVPEHELIDFRTQVESLAAAHGGTVSAPEMRAALEAAHALDRACAEVDIQIALHVVGVDPKLSVEHAAFRTAPRKDGLTFLLDVPTTPDLMKSYEAMVKHARSLGGRLVDDNGNPLDDRALAAIGVEIEATRARMAEIGIEPGSPLALRLFS